MTESSFPLMKVTVIGGGTGIYPVTAALKQLDVSISTIIAVSDSGGSSGRIRDEYGFQPVGDMRQSLAALAEGEGQEWITKLLLYRFDKGDLKGHNLGNLILTALQDLTGSTSEALYRAQQVFSLEGRVIPSANEVIDVKIHYQDGSELIGEDYLNPESGIEKRVQSIELTPEATANKFAIKAIEEADLIIIGPGDLYASLLATVLPKGIKEAFQNSSAKILFISNLMTRHWQTDGMTAGQHAKSIEEVIGKPIDIILLNSQEIPQQVLDVYHQYHEEPVIDDVPTDDPKAVRAPVISDVKTQKAKGDKLHRSYLRHDSQKLKPVLSKILKELKSIS